MKTKTIHVQLSFVMIAAITLSAVNVIANRVVQGQQKQDDSIRLSATLVQVPTVVTDRAGNFVTDLSRNDFAVFEDGKRQEVSLFAAVKQPFNAVLVLDTSNSAQDRLRAIQYAALNFAREIGPGDRIMVLSFDNEVRELTDFTGNLQEIEAAIKATESGFGKLLYEAVTRGLEQLKDVEGRRALILFSDGVDMKSIEATAESTTRLAEEIGAVIYVVRFDTRWWMEAEARRQKNENTESKVPFSIDGRIPLPPDFGGPDPTPTGIPKPSTPRIEIGQRPSPPVTVIDGTTGERRRVQTAPPDPVTQNLDKIYGEADAYMKALSSRTGGRVFPAETFEGTRSAFAAIAEELRNQYLIGYYPASDRRDGKYHKITVEVSRKDLRVRARPGYRAYKDEPGKH